MNGENCICSKERCLDAKMRPQVLEIGQAEEHYYEFGWEGIPCQNVILMVQTITGALSRSTRTLILALRARTHLPFAGDQDMYLSYTGFPLDVNDRYDTYQWYSENYLSDSLVFCNQRGDGIATADGYYSAQYHGIPMWLNSVRHASSM